MNLEQTLNEITGKLYGKNIGACTDAQLYTGVLQLTKEKMAETPAITGDKKVYYISMEFLIGKLLSNNLINLGIYEELSDILKKNGKTIADIEEAEPEPSLGNGGLGRLAACFLDSIATLGLPGDGIGLNYHFGLFKQVFKDHLQNAEKNDWIQKDSWLNNTGTKFEVSFGDRKVTSVLYDIDVVGYENGLNKLHLFDVETVDESLVKKGITFDKKAIEKNLTLFLYPDDSDEAGNLLRIYQEYFMVCNGAQLILKEVKEKGYDLHTLPEHVAIQINDTHPTMVIPELIRILKGFGMEVVANDLFPDPQYAAEAGIAYVPLDELYARADIVSLHCPLTDRTRYMIGDAAISRMKPGVILINTGRGQLIHTEALIDGAACAGGHEDRGDGERAGTARRPAQGGRAVP